MENCSRSACAMFRFQTGPEKPESVMFILDRCERAPAGMAQYKHDRKQVRQISRIVTKLGRKTTELLELSQSGHRHSNPPAPGVLERAIRSLMR